MKRLPNKTFHNIDAVSGNEPVDRVNYYAIYWVHGESDYAIYDRELFISTAEKRQLALEKLGI